MTVEELKNQLDELIKEGKGNYFIADLKGFHISEIIVSDVYKKVRI